MPPSRLRPCRVVAPRLLTAPLRPPPALLRLVRPAPRYPAAAAVPAAFAAQAAAAAPPAAAAADAAAAAAAQAAAAARAGAWPHANVPGPGQVLSPAHQQRRQAARRVRHGAQEAVPQARRAAMAASKDKEPRQAQGKAREGEGHRRRQGVLQA
ncbi:hypothetical protein FGB62_1g110 [Gracilaria domingensis]|nr:hypothetical protein FGB62_1g110 [Gracilaria domingensis]